MKRSPIVLIFMMIVSMVLTSGCTKEDDATPDGTSRSAYLGKWSVSESWTKLAYEVTISEDPGSTDGVFISNFANTGLSATPASATVSGSTIVLDPNQVISGLKISGSGTLSGTRISWNYTIDDGANLIIAVATYTRQ